MIDDDVTPFLTKCNGCDCRERGETVGLNVVFVWERRGGGGGAGLKIEISFVDDGMGITEEGLGATNATIKT